MAYIKVIIIVIVIIIAGQRATIRSVLQQEELLWFSNILVIAVNHFVTILYHPLIGIVLIARAVEYRFKW